MTVVEEQAAATGPMPMSEWRELARDRVLRLAETGRPFTWDDVQEHLPVPASPRAAGQVTSTLHRQGLIRPVGYAVSGKAVNRGAPIRQWRGTAVTLTGPLRGQRSLFEADGW